MVLSVLCFIYSTCARTQNATRNCRIVRVNYQQLRVSNFLSYYVLRIECQAKQLPSDLWCKEFKPWLRTRKINRKKPLQKLANV